MASLIIRHKSHPLNPNLFNFLRSYSSSSSNNDIDGNLSSLFTPNEDKQPQQQQSSSSTKVSSLDDIRTHLSGFSRRPSENAPFSSNSNTPIPDLNKLNPIFSKGGNISFDKIRSSLSNMRESNKFDLKKDGGEQFSLDKYKESFRTKPSIDNNNNNNASASNSIRGSMVFGGTIDSLPKGTFGQEINEISGVDDSSKFELDRVYTHAELGELLKKLRPEKSSLSGKGKKGAKEGEEGWFSLSELQKRIGKLKEIEEVESSKSLGGKLFGDIRKSLNVMKNDKETPMGQKLDLLVPSSFTTSPPQEHLIEKYFHPDNMSSAEKLKIQLKKVRDEFKMSESDCGSTRVQIAQLTTEIHHLSAVLHKKDKHSRKGLQAKVQQRKKLLKYLRRTDWDSYCFVLSKLGLRDSMEYRS